MRPIRVAACLIVLVLAATPVRAQDGSAFPTSASTWSSGTSYSTPRAGSLLPSKLFDPTRFSIHNAVMFGYTSGGGFQGSSGLLTSSLGYRVSSHSLLRVDIGAHMNPAFGGGETQKGVFLQGASFDWRPSRSSLVRFEYRDLRSPLQGWGYGGYGGGYGYGYGSGYGFGSPALGYRDDAPLGSGLPGDPLRN